MDLADLQERTRRFVDDVVVPEFEPRDDGRGHGPDEGLRRELQAAAKAAGLFAPHLRPDLGGLGLDVRGQAVVFEEAGRSLLGPLALNCAAPDEGNGAMLEKIATAEQQERFLAPLAAGDVRSCFAMTEPRPGAGSDPSMLQTTARQEAGGGDWVVDGEKWFITGGVGAAFAIVMAKTEHGATMFLTDTDVPGFEVLAAHDTIDAVSPGGHAHLRLTGVRIPADQVLGEPHKGFRYAQVRLAPARLTHCMRWLGLARRAMEVAIDRARGREAFGATLSDLGLAQRLIADAEIDIATSRAVIAHTAAVLDSGEGDATLASSIAKVHVSEATFRIVDSAVQLCGSDGITQAPLGRYVNEIRPFRIYDGPNETHRWSIAKKAVRARERGAAAR